MHAFKDGVSIINEANLNELLTVQPFTLLYTGSLIDSKTGNGVFTNDVSLNSYAFRFTATGVSAMSRLELDLDADGIGQDMTIEVRGSNFDPAGSTDGTLLKTVVVPKEFLPSSHGYWYVPLNLMGLTAGANYWIIIKKCGDATNHFNLVGESSQDAAHPCYYRAASSGVWTGNNALHFKMYSGNTGVPIHEIYGTNGYITILYSSGVPSTEYLYLPPSDGAAGGIRKKINYTYNAGILTGGEFL